MSEQSDPNEAIRQRAYEIWEAEGRPEGREEAHWAAAERELVGRSSAKIPSFGAMGAAPKRKKATTRASGPGKAPARGGRTRRV